MKRSKVVSLSEYKKKKEIEKQNNNIHSLLNQRYLDYKKMEERNKSFNLFWLALGFSLTSILFILAGILYLGFTNAS